MTGSARKVFITGKSGYIAKKLAKNMKEPWKIITTSRDCSGAKDCLHLNLLNPNEFCYSQIGSGDYVLHLAGISSPDICAKDQYLSRNINVTGARYFMRKCVEQDARVLFFSSDTVYGAGEEVFNEDSICHPVCIYGQMKHEVERAFLKKRRIKIFRLSYVFSRNDKFMSYLMKCTKEGKPAEIYHPFYRNAVYWQDVLDAVRNICDNWESFESSVFNICGPELLSRKDIAYMYRNFVDRNLEMRVVPQVDETFFKARPRMINMQSKYLEGLLGRKPKKIAAAMVKEFG